VRYFDVHRDVGDAWAVWGDLEWTNHYRRIYAVCPTREAADVACRLLSVGEGPESKSGE
jgi:hypothetical protein